MVLTIVYCLRPTVITLHLIDCSNVALTQVLLTLCCLVDLKLIPHFIHTSVTAYSMHLWCIWSTWHEFWHPGKITFMFCGIGLCLQTVQLQTFWPSVLFLSFPCQAFKEMLYAAQDQAPSIEGKETPCLRKQTQTHTHTHTHRYTLLYPLPPAWEPVWASPE